MIHLKKSLNCQIIPENYKKLPMLVLMNIAQIMNLWDDALKQKLKCLKLFYWETVFWNLLIHELWITVMFGYEIANSTLEKL